MASASPTLGGQYIPGNASGMMAGSNPPRPMYAEGDEKQASKLRDWQWRQIPWLHPYRLRLARGWRRSDLFKQGLQWLRLSYNLTAAGTMHYSPIEFDDEDDSAVPTPTFDHFSGPLDNEASRLGKAEFKGYARYDEGADLKARTAAKLTQQLLESELERMKWGETYELANLHMPMYGQAILLSQWQTDWSDTTLYPKEGLLRCPAEGCGFRSVGATVPDGMAEGLQEGALETLEGDDGELSHTLKTCPTCETHPETRVTPQAVVDPYSGLVSQVDVEEQIEAPGGPALEPWEPDASECSGKDHFGRPLGDEIPNGVWHLGLESPYDAFPFNLGVDENNLSLRSITFCSTHPVPWFTQFFANGYLVKRETPAEIMRYNPVAGERTLFYGNQTLLGTADGLFQNHCRLRTTYVLPWREKVLDEEGRPVLDPSTGEPLLQWNKGRCIQMAGDVLLVDGDFMIESKRNPGEFFPRAHWECVVWGARSGGREWWGDSMSNRLFDAQENINEIFSQIQDARQACGSPKWLVPKGLDFDFNNAAEAGAQWVFDWDPNHPEIQPREVGNTLLNIQIYSELEAMTTFIDTASYNSQVEQGNVPPGVAAALAIQMLAEQTNEQRRPRIKRMKQALERLWSHGMKLNHELVLDTRLFWKQPDGPGEWAQESWSGEDIGGMTDIHIKAEPEHDSAIQKQQLVRDMIDAGLFDMSDPRTRRAVARAMGGDSDLLEQQERQEKCAEIEYITYRDGGHSPVVDEEIDDDQAHYERHTFDAKSEWTRDKEKQARWLDALPFVSGWSQPIGPPIQMGIDALTGQPVEQAQPSPFDIFLMPSDRGGGDGGMLPNSYEIRVVGCWRWMLMQVGWQPADQAEAEALEWVLRFRAHIASHLVNATRDAAAAMAGQPVMQPGGAPSTSIGTLGPGTLGQPAPQDPNARVTQVPGSTMPVPATPAGAAPAPVMA